MLFLIQIQILYKEMKTFGDYIIEKLKLSKDSVKKPKEIDPIFADLDLPSGTIWGRYDITHNRNEYIIDYKERGDWGSSANKFSWGEVKSKTVYQENTYKHGESNYAPNKYNNDDKKTELEPKDDAATEFDSKFKIPTAEQLKELIEHTENEWVENYNDVKGLNGYVFRGNGDEIFFSASGYYNKSGAHEYRERGYYMSSTLSGSIAYPQYMEFGKDGVEVKSRTTMWRYCGYGVHPVKK